MHKLLTIIVFALTSFYPSYFNDTLACSCSSTASAEEKSDKEKLTLKVGGMTCEGCAKKVRKALLSVRGVVDCHVHLEEKTAHLMVEKGTDSRKFIEAIESAGYEAVVLDEKWED